MNEIQKWLPVVIAAILKGKEIASDHVITYSEALELVSVIIKEAGIGDKPVVKI
jgi:hypothetical protein